MRESLLATTHTMHYHDARDMSALPGGSVHVIVTSPPYPMIAMWDSVFSALDPETGAALDAGDGPAAFERMHRALDPVWAGCARALCPGGIACINIGDAVRTVGGVFQLYSNHARIIRAFLDLGLHCLPAIIWRKQTNAPNKFMGSGMLPPGAYVTLEHEFVLVFRKGDKRAFTGADKERRRASALFWEERNAWFSDVWFDLKGAVQVLADKAARARSGAFPFELPWRLIHMFSLQGDMVLDPFAGTGSTLAAAAASGRGSAGFEIDESLRPAIEKAMHAVPELASRKIRARLDAHDAFVRERCAAGKTFKHTNETYGAPCMSAQETGIAFHPVARISQSGEDAFTAEYDHESGNAKTFFQLT